MAIMSLPIVRAVGSLHANRFLGTAHPVTNLAALTAKVEPFGVLGRGKSYSVVQGCLVMLASNAGSERINSSPV